MEATRKDKNIKFTPSVTSAAISLKGQIRVYQKRAKEIEEHLIKRPDDWPKFQNEFNNKLNNIFNDILEFEKSNVKDNHLDKIKKLKNIFVRRFRKVFMKGVYGPWSIIKPLGYPGDFKIIEDIYLNAPQTTGFDRLFDNYFMSSAISIAVRNRKEDIKNIIINYATEKREDKLNIMDLASGPCREIREILSENLLRNKNVLFDCYDNEQKALDYARLTLNGYPQANFYRQNVLKLCAVNGTGSQIKKTYDIIYSTGLFDYLNDKVAIRLIRNLRNILNAGGILVITNVRDKYSNPSVHYMEWAGDWNLYYRTEGEFKNIFKNAGFTESELSHRNEQQKIIQYIIATKKY